MCKRLLNNKINADCTLFFCAFCIEKIVLSSYIYALTIRIEMNILLYRTIGCAMNNSNTIANVIFNL